MCLVLPQQDRQDGFALPRCANRNDVRKSPPMPAPSERIRAAALHAQLELADERTPFVFDSWYVAALAEEISRRPLARRILGLPLVLFRREDGRAVALVRDFALIESGRLVWIWMGEAEAADPALLPQQDWMNDPAWVSSTERMHLEASYGFCRNRRERPIGIDGVIDYATARLKKQSAWENAKPPGQRNCPFLIMCMISTPAISRVAEWNSLKPIIGRTRRSMARWLCSTRLFK